MSALADLRKLIRLARGDWTTPLMQADEAQRVYDAVRAEVLTDVADRIKARTLRQAADVLEADGHLMAAADLREMADAAEAGGPRG